MVMVSRLSHINADLSAKSHFIEVKHATSNNTIPQKRLMTKLLMRSIYVECGISRAIIEAKCD